MKKVLVVLAAAFATVALTAAPGFAGTNDQVCPEGDSGKIDAGGTETSITITAPEGFLISGYCVKAGSEQQGDGPEFVTVDPPQASVTITHSSGKGISHYSYTLVAAQTTTGGTTGGTAATPTGGNLPFTGLPVWIPLLAAAAMLASGIFLVRRRKGELS